MEEQINVKVAIRVRPMNAMEHASNCSEIIRADSPTDLIIKDPSPYAKVENHPFSFDHVFNKQTQQIAVYKALGIPIMEKALDGFNGTIFAYGQTGSGKTHSITGTPSMPGIVPMMNDELFERIKNAPPNKRFMITVSYLELYNENIFDLYNTTNKTPLKVREHPKTGIYVEDLKEIIVKSSREIHEKMEEGNGARHVASTKMNDRSSRSHSVFTIKIEQKEFTEQLEEGANLSAKINLVDLAGSERVGKTEAEGQTLKEAAQINSSLSALGNVINALADPKKKKGHIPYRSSKLTRLLQDSLGGNTITVMIAACSPADRNFEETLNTLQYANRAKNICNNSKKNESNPAVIVAELKKQIEELRAKILNKGGSNNDSEELQNSIASLEYAKGQEWAEKERISKEYEESRFVSLAKNGLLLFKVNMLRNSNLAIKEKIEQLQDEIDILNEEAHTLNEAINTKSEELEKTLGTQLEIEKVRKQAQDRLRKANRLRIVDRWQKAMRAVKYLNMEKRLTLHIEKLNTYEEIEQKNQESEEKLRELLEISKKAPDLDSKFKCGVKELKLLYSELERLERENSKLKNSLKKKDKQMKTLMDDVQGMLAAESTKMEKMESTIQSEIKEGKKYTAKIKQMEEILVQADGEFVNLMTMKDKLAVRSEQLKAKHAKEIEELREMLKQELEVLGASQTQSEEAKMEALEIALTKGELGDDMKNQLLDGVLLCKLINNAAPGTIDERVINIQVLKGSDKAIENILLALNSAEALGCNIEMIKLEDLIQGDEVATRKLIREVTRVNLLSAISPSRCKELLILREPDESMPEFVQLSPEILLMRWVNYHLRQQLTNREMTNFGTDLQSSEFFYHLLHCLYPNLGPVSFSPGPTPLDSAETFLTLAEKIKGARKFITPPDIANCNEDANILFLANLFRIGHGLSHVDVKKLESEAQNDFQTNSSSSRRVGGRVTHSSKDENASNNAMEELLECDAADKREERNIRVWINSLGISKHLKSIKDEMRDGIMMVEVLEKLDPSIINWKRINKNSKTMYSKIENCNYVVEAARQLKFSLVGIAGKDFYDGNMKFALSLLTQAMQHKVLANKKLSSGGVVKEHELIKRANQIISDAGKKNRVSSFRDSSFARGLFLIDLLDSLIPGAVNYKLVSTGQTKNDFQANAKYIITIVRKLGCKAFISWEDIVQVNSKMLLGFVGNLLDLKK